LKRWAFVIASLLALIVSSSGRAESGLSFGVGVGALYSGLGVNVGTRSEHAFGYLAAGCIAVSHSSSEGWDLPCGVGAGWIWTGLLTKANDRHGVGIYAGPVSTNTRPGHDKVNYGAGLTYVYSFGDTVAKGLQLGITPTVGKKNGEYRGGVLINLGYQF